MAWHGEQGVPVRRNADDGPGPEPTKPKQDRVLRAAFLFVARCSIETGNSAAPRPENAFSEHPNPGIPSTLELLPPHARVDPTR